MIPEVDVSDYEQAEGYNPVTYQPLAILMKHPTELDFSGCEDFLKLQGTVLDKQF